MSEVYAIVHIYPDNSDPQINAFRTVRKAHRHMDKLIREYREEGVKLVPTPGAANYWQSRNGDVVVYCTRLIVG